MTWEDIVKNRDMVNSVKERKQRVAERRKLRESPSYFLQSVKQLKDTIKTLEKLSKKYDYDKKKMIDNTIAGLEQQIDKLMNIALDKGDTFEKGAGGVSFGGHGTNPELFNIRYGKKRRKKDGERN